MGNVNFITTLILIPDQLKKEGTTPASTREEVNECCCSRSPLSIVYLMFLQGPLPQRGKKKVHTLPVYPIYTL